MSKQGALTRFASLEKDYHDFASNHNKIISLYKEDKTHEYFSSFISEAAEENYLDRVTEFKEFLEKLKSLEPPPVQIQPPVLPLSPTLNASWSFFP